MSAMVAGLVRFVPSRLEMQQMGVHLLSVASVVALVASIFFLSQALHLYAALSLVSGGGGYLASRKIASIPNSGFVRPAVTEVALRAARVHLRRIPPQEPAPTASAAADHLFPQEESPSAQQPVAAAAGNGNPAQAQQEPQPKPAQAASSSPQGKAAAGAAESSVRAEARQEPPSERAEAASPPPQAEAAASPLAAPESSRNEPPEAPAASSAADHPFPQEESPSAQQPVAAAAGNGNPAQAQQEPQPKPAQAASSSPQGKAAAGAAESSVRAEARQEPPSERAEAASPPPQPKAAPAEDSPLAVPESSRNELPEAPAAEAAGCGFPRAGECPTADALAAARNSLKKPSQASKPEVASNSLAGALRGSIVARRASVASSPGSPWRDEPSSPKKTSQAAALPAFVRAPLLEAPVPDDQARARRAAMMAQLKERAPVQPNGEEAAASAANGAPAPSPETPQRLKPLKEEESPWTTPTTAAPDNKEESKPTESDVKNVVRTLRFGDKKKKP